MVSCLDAGRAMQPAQAADRDSPKGLLDCIPFAIKDISDTADMPTCWGTAIYSTRQPAEMPVNDSLCLYAGTRVTGRQITGAREIISAVSASTNAVKGNPDDPVLFFRTD